MQYPTRAAIVSVYDVSDPQCALISQPIRLWHFALVVHSLPG